METLACLLLKYLFENLVTNLSTESTFKEFEVLWLNKTFRAAWCMEVSQLRFHCKALIIALLQHHHFVIFLLMFSVLYLSKCSEWYDLQRNSSNSVDQAHRVASVWLNILSIMMDENGLWVVWDIFSGFFLLMLSCRNFLAHRESIFHTANINLRRMLKQYLKLTDSVAIVTAIVAFSVYLLGLNTHSYTQKVTQSTVGPPGLAGQWVACNPSVLLATGPTQLIASWGSRLPPLRDWLTVHIMCLDNLDNILSFFSFSFWSQNFLLLCTATNLQSKCSLKPLFHCKAVKRFRNFFFVYNLCILTWFNDYCKLCIHCLGVIHIWYHIYSFLTSKKIHLKFLRYNFKT